MIFTIYGSDWLMIDEANINQLYEKDKIHLIKFCFESPSMDKINEVFDRFPSTNRYIVDGNIRFYNDILKNRKKYYVENRPGVGLISFFKKNNKVLLNYNNLSSAEREFVDENISDVLRNIEVFYIRKRDQLKEKWIEELRHWNGNILVQE